MKYLKSYEIHLDDYPDPLPKIGQFVIMYATTHPDVAVKKFIESNVGQIVNVIKYNNLTPDIIVEYEDIPDYLRFYTHNKYGTSFYFTHIEDINHISTNKEDLELIFTSKKYNL